MDDQSKLKVLFPRASKSFFQANETKIDTQIPHAHPKRHKATALVKVATGKEKSLGRIAVFYRLCRVRPLDPDGVSGSTKDITDGLCRCGLLPGDNPFQITVTVEQERVDHYSDERTELEIDYPDGFFE